MPKIAVIRGPATSSAPARRVCVNANAANHRGHTGTVAAAALGAGGQRLERPRSSGKRPEARERRPRNAPAITQPTTAT